MRKESELRALQTKLKKFKICILTAGASLGQDACLFYVAWSNAKDESIGYLRKQLLILHTYIISAGTRAIMKHFRNNPSYDLVNDDKLCFRVPALKEYCNYVWQDPATFLNLYLPMRLHPLTRHSVHQIILRHKPQTRVLTEEQQALKDAEEKKDVQIEENENMYYYGVLMMNHTVISIFKNNPDIAVTPVDINILHSYTKTNLKDRHIDDVSFFKEICLPGMTEDFKLPVLYTYSQKSDLKIVYVCEERNEKIRVKLTDLSNRIFADLF